MAKGPEPTFADPFGEAAWADRPSRLRRPPGGAAPIAATLAAALLFGLGVAILAAAQSYRSPPQEPAADTPQPPPWVDIVKPMEVFSLDAPDLARDTKFYLARRSRDGDGRQDTLGFGQLNGQGNNQDPFLRLMVYRIGSEPVRPVSFYVDMARRAAAAELSIGHSLQPQESLTRFGRFEVADLDLLDKDGAATPCLGFRGTVDAPSLQMIGLACGTKAKPLSRPGLVCLIERLDLNSAAEDPTLARFFAEAELKRNPACARTALGPAPVHANWLDQADARPPLKPRKTR